MEKRKEIIENTQEPVTTSSLIEDFRDLGINEGDSLFVHSSLSSLGWVCGRAPAVIDALQEVVTEEGTIMMPTFTWYRANVSAWEKPPLPDDWFEIIQEEMPAFRPKITPTDGVGAIPECFRNYPGTVRSCHPEVSFAAWGKNAEKLVEDHELDYGLGEGSPLAEFYYLGGYVLLLGTGHGHNTSLHLAEQRADYPKEEKKRGVSILRDGEQEWVEYTEIEKDAGEFDEVGEAFEDQIGVIEGKVGEAKAKLMDQRELVDFGVKWFEENRQKTTDSN